MELASGNYDANSTDVISSAPDYEDFQHWQATTIACQVIIATCLAATVWILLSMIFYGTKTRRWRHTPGTSSLNSGVIFTTCVAAITVIVPRIAMNLVLGGIHSTDNTSFTCSTAGDLVGVTFFAGECATYLFLWVLQRHIYTHPSVQNRVNVHVDRFSKVFFVIIVGTFVGTGYVYVKDLKTKFDPYYGCQPDRINDARVRLDTIVISVIVVLLQTSSLFLFVHPAVRASFNAPRELGENREQAPGPSRIQVISRWIPCSCGKDVYIGSPIEMTVKRAIFSAICIVLSDIAAPVLDIAAMPKWAPKIFPVPSHDLSALVNVLAMVYTFSYASSVLTVFVPNCPEWTCRTKKTVAPSNEMTMTIVSCHEENGKDC